MKYYIIGFLILFAAVVVGCSFLPARQQAYKLDVQCTCPDGTTVNPKTKVPEILVAYVW